MPDHRRFPCDDLVQRQVIEYIGKLRREGSSRSVVIGVQGVQGIGKSFLCCDAIPSLLQDCRVATLSLDDFYKPRAEMGEATTRGHPGTHDIQLLAQSIDRLVRHREPVCVPVYDKTALNGRGDRGGWRSIDAAPDVVLVEGWCVGFTADAVDDATNRHVAEYAELLLPRFDGLVVLQSDRALAYAWRERAEESSRRAGLGALSKEAIVLFVDHYMPLYARYLDRLHASDPIASTLHVKVEAGEAIEC